MTHTTFPPPVRIAANSTRWRLSELLAHEARVSGQPEPGPLPPTEERYLTAPQVAERYGVAVVTVWRWARASKQAAA